jgi:hypothetical protein
MSTSVPRYQEIKTRQSHHLCYAWYIAHTSSGPKNDRTVATTGDRHSGASTTRPGCACQGCYFQPAQEVLQINKGAIAPCVGKITGTIIASCPRYLKYGFPIVIIVSHHITRYLKYILLVVIIVSYRVTRYLCRHGDGLIPSQ